MHPGTLERAIFQLGLLKACLLASNILYTQKTFKHLGESLDELRCSLHIVSYFLKKLLDCFPNILYIALSCLEVDKNKSN